MKTRHSSYKWIHGAVISLLLTTAYPAHVYGQQESIVVDPVTGDYTITYQGLDLEGNPKWHQVVYVPATKNDPLVRSKFRLNDKHIITYSYKVQNRLESKQAIDGFRGFASHVISGSQTTPKDWDGNILPDFDSAGQESGLRVNWSFDTSGGLVPGKSQGGFSYESSHLPGVGVARLTGAVDALNGFPDEGPGDDNPIYSEFRKLMLSDFVPRHVTAPKIRVPDPFDTSVVLAGIQNHIKQDLVSMSLVEPVFASQLDRILQAAIDAAKLNNTKAVRENLKDLRKLLKKEHGNVDKEDDEVESGPKKVADKQSPIDKLAAKVLDFDFKYVEQRVKGDKD